MRTTKMDTTTLSQVVKNVVPKLVPFFKTVVIYFVLFIPQDKPSVFAMCIKCLPIISLMLFICLHRINLSNEYSYSRKILYGLVFSCIGDAFLIWPQHFASGMVAFSLAQIMYIQAFGFKPLNLKVGATLYIVAGPVLLLVLPGVRDPLVWFALPIYSTLVTTTVWRAITTVQFHNELSWTKLCSCVGSILFLISDTVIGVSYFYMPIPHSQAIIMSTYYLAQLGISLSIVDTYKAKQIKDTQEVKKAK